MTTRGHLNPTQDLHPLPHIPEPSLGTESLAGGTLPCVSGKTEDGVVAAKLDSAKEGDGVESSEEQEQQDGGGEGRETMRHCGQSRIEKRVSTLLP